MSISIYFYISIYLSIYLSGNVHPGGLAISLMSVTLLFVPLTFPEGTLLQKMKLLYSVRAPLFVLYPETLIGTNVV